MLATNSSKGSKDLEFGNTLFMCESTEGLLLHCKPYSQKPPRRVCVDERKLAALAGLPPRVADRSIGSGPRIRFASSQSSARPVGHLRGAGAVRNWQDDRAYGGTALCAIAAPMQGHRRAYQTLKNHRHKAPISAKGFESQLCAAASSVLSYNLS